MSNNRLEVQLLENERLDNKIRWNNTMATQEAQPIFTLPIKVFNRVYNLLMYIYNRHKVVWLRLFSLLSNSLFNKTSQIDRAHITWEASKKSNLFLEETNRRKKEITKTFSRFKIIITLKNRLKNRTPLYQNRIQSQTKIPK